MIQQKQRTFFSYAAIYFQQFR